MKKKYIITTIIVLIVFAVVIDAYIVFHKHKKSSKLVLYGNVDVRQVDIGFRVAGRVVLMPFQEGDFVPEGTLMGTLEDQPYADQVKEAKSNLEAIKTNLANSELVLKRREELVTDGGVSWEDYDNARAQRDVYLANLKEAEASLGVAEKNLHDVSVYAPSDGTILTRIREPGAVVGAGDPIYTLSLISPVWIRAFISEPRLGEIYYGMPAKVFTDTKGGHSYDGHVGFISPVAEFTPKTVETTELRTDLVYRLRIIADNPDKYLKQGMPVTVRLYPKKSQE